ncbi:MAG TPA: response regulator, partial [Anaeromyxobacteraceae bacterium]|nr:response regulator [Anaeromyxobacteraceae bacterium]
MAKTLLLADDSVTIQKVVGMTFAGEDFDITTVDNGEDALARARQRSPDVILADVVMPRRNGYELCEAIKSDPSLRHIPVLLLAGTFEAFDEARARAVRADGHIAKPFESQSLIDKVKEVMGSAATVAAPPPQGVTAQATPPRASPPVPGPAAVRPVAVPRAGAPLSGARPPAGAPPFTGRPPAGNRPSVGPPPSGRPPFTGAPPVNTRPPTPPVSSFRPVVASSSPPPGSPPFKGTRSTTVPVPPSSVQSAKAR